MNEKITLCTKNDFDVSYFCGSGPGGQARNKVASGVQIIHKETGAIGRASDSRSQFENRCKAFERLCATPKFKFWVSQKKFEIEHQMTIEQAVEKEMTDANLKFEVKDSSGAWQEVQSSYFETKEAAAIR